MQASIERPDLLIAHAGGMLRWMGEADPESQIRAQIGSELANPSLEGIDLTAPIEIIYLDPARFPAPVVWRFRTSDPGALRWAIFQSAMTADHPLGCLNISGNVACWAHDAAAISAAADVPPVKATSTSGRITFRMEPARLIKANPAAFRGELDAMRARMADALSSVDRSEKDIQTAQQQLERIASIIRHVESINAELSVEENSDILNVRLKLVSGSPLSALLSAFAPAQLRLKDFCPPETAVLFDYNIVLDGLMGNLLSGISGLGAFGMGSGASAFGGEEALAIFTSPAVEGPLELLDLRAGSKADAAVRWWDYSLKTQQDDEAFFLKALPPQDEDQSMRRAQLIPNEKVLGKRGTAVIKHLIGDVTLAAQQKLGSLVVTAFGGNPSNRLRQVNSLDGRPGDSLTGVSAWRLCMEHISPDSRVLVYVAPDAIVRWLKLGGLEAKRPSMGLAGGVSIESGTVVMGLIVPTDLPLK